ncbi:MAG: hypothetical protein B6244_14900 [Candidatus Cloacimonetes bacterium 4572_55]|nr:MAG: hypothetical protein B6244_14900 [Candidatus Cloacimonetes bacterium 4572_55]
MDFYEESQRKQAKRDAEKQQKRLAEKEKREAEKRQRREQALAFFAQAQEEERKQKRKWFGKKFKPAINLYEKAARLGHTEAQRKANELKK